MTKIFPTIDIINGKSVRLTEGKADQKTTYEVSPLDMAKRYEDLGASCLHIVDLDAALNQGSNVKLIEKIANQSNLYIELGGGIKASKDVQIWLNAGVNQVIIGSLAVKEPETVGSIIEEFGAESIVIGADMMNNEILINGWKESSNWDLIDFIKFYEKSGATKFLCTDVSKDGKLQGTATELYKNLKLNFPKLNFLASGGVASLEEIQYLIDKDMYGIVVGKAIYEQAIDLEKLFILC